MARLAPKLPKRERDPKMPDSDQAVNGSTEGRLEPLRQALARRVQGRSRWLRVAGVVAVAVVVAGLPLVLDSYFMLLLNLALVYVIVGLGMVILLGWSGQFAFISVAFMAIGAYSGGRLASVTDLPVEMSLLVATLAGATIGLILGAAAVRLRRYYLAIVTIAFMEMVNLAIQEGGAITRGVQGFRVNPPRLFLAGNLELATEVSRYYVGVVLALATFLLAIWLRRTRLARGWASLREDESLAQSFGVNTYRSKLIAFTLCSAIFSYAGAWYTFVNIQIYPESFNFGELIFHFLIVIIAGTISAGGAVVAAVVLAVAREYLRGFVGISEILFGGALLLAVLFVRGGLYGLASRLLNIRERWL